MRRSHCPLVAWPDVIGSMLPRRWVVERTFAWLNRCRRLAKDWENLNRNALAFLSSVTDILMWKRPAHFSQSASLGLAGGATRYSVCIGGHPNRRQATAVGHDRPPSGSWQVPSLGDSAGRDA